MAREKSISVRFAAVGGHAVKAEMRDIGQAGRSAMQNIVGASDPASDSLESIGRAASSARLQLEAMAARSAAAAAKMRPSIPAVSDLQSRVNTSTGVSPLGGQSSAEILAQGQALDDLRAKFSPLFSAIRAYREQISEIKMAHATGALSTEEMANAISSVRREALGAIDKIKGISAANREAARAADDAAKALARQGQQASDLRAKYNPAFGVIRQYKAEVQAIRAAHASGALSADEMANAISRVRQSSLASLSAIKGQTQAIEQMSRASRGGALRMQQMFYQVNDIGVSLAGGMNPFVVMAQQGTQIAQIYGFGGGGVRGIFKDLLGLITKMPGPIKAVGVAIGVGAIGIRSLQNEINKTSSITVSFGDTAKAVFQVLGRNIYSLIKPAIDMIAPWFNAGWEKVKTGFKDVGNYLINGVRAAVLAIDTAISQVPLYFERAWQKAKSIVLHTLGDMAWAVFDMLNGVASGLNAVFGTNLQANGAIQEIGTKLTNAGTDALIASTAVGSALSGAGADFDAKRDAIMADDPMGRFFDDVSKQAQENARNREKDKKKKGGGKERAGKEEKRAIDDLIASLQQELSVLRETDPIKKKMLEYSEQLKDATAAEREKVLGLVTALDAAQHGFEAVGRALFEFYESSKRTGQEWGTSFVNVISGAGDKFAEFVTTGKAGFSDLIQSWAADIAKLAFKQHIGGPLASLMGGWLGGGGGGDPLVSALQGAGLAATMPSFDGGGSTGFGSRSGGLDGKGGFAAMLHPNETVLDHSKGQGRSADRVMVGVDPRNGNLTAFVDSRIQASMPSAFEAYGRSVLPHQMRSFSKDRRAIG